MTESRLFFKGLLLTALAGGMILLWARPGFGIFLHLLYVHDLPAAGLAALILLIAGFIGHRLSWPEKIVAVLASRPLPAIAATAILLCLGSLTVYRNHPLCMDEYAVMFQARIFAAGHLAGQFPPGLIDALIPAGFQNHFLTASHTSGAVVSSYWPGFSLILTPFAALGIPWACNTVITAFSLYLLWRMAEELSPTSQASGWAVLLGLATPALWAIGISYYSMQAHLLLNLAYAWLLFRPTWARVVGAGAIGSLALVQHNPFPHVAFALPWVVWLAWRPDRFKNLLCLGLGYMPLTLLLGLAWLLFQRGLVEDPTALIGASAAQASPDLLQHAGSILPTLLQPFRWPTEVIVLYRAMGLVKLWLWTAPLLIILAWMGARLANGDPRLRLLAASALTTFFAYVIVPVDQGHGWGYRYFHPALGVLPLLAAIAVIRFGEAMRRALALAAVLSLTLATALRADQIGEFMTAHLSNMPPMDPTQRQVAVFTPRGYYAIDLVQNDPWLRGSPVILLSQGEKRNEELLARYFPGARLQAANQHGRSYTLPVKSTALDLAK